MNTLQKQWQNFLTSHPAATIHQTIEFKNFSDTIPNRGKTWIIMNSDKTAGTILVRYKLPKGYSWLYAPRGPLLTFESSDQSKQQLEDLLREIKKITKQEKAIFLRIDPLLEENSSSATNFIKQAQSLKFQATKHGFQPQHTLIVDLSKTPEEILAQMKPKGRYNIKIATKKGVKIRISDPENQQQFEQDINDYYQILKETTVRDGFSGHDKKYYQNMIKMLGNSAKLYLAENLQGKVIAAAIITFFQETATYYYGVSSNQDRNLMAPYLLHWTAMNNAKEQGYTKYDFFGIAPPNSPNHPWKGVTEFKQKFGGQEYSYLPAYEKPLNKVLYWLYRIYKAIKN